MIDTTLIEKLTELAAKEKKIKEYKKRIRIKGKVSSKSLTKSGNIRLEVIKEGEKYSFTIIKTHRERFALAGKIATGRSVFIEGIPKFRMIICTKLKILDKGVDEGRQERLEI